MKTDLFTEHLRKILHDQDNNHSDICFHIEIDNKYINSHKSILSARSPYFQAMFRKGGLSESISSNKVVTISNYDYLTFSRALEFIYTNTIENYDLLDSESLIALLMISNEYLMEDLKSFCSIQASKLLNIDNLIKFIVLCTNHSIKELKDYCIHFIRENKSILKQNTSFREEIEACPEIGLLFFEVVLQSDDINFSTRFYDNKTKRVRLNQDSVVEMFSSQTIASNMIQSSNLSENV